MSDFYLLEGEEVVPCSLEQWGASLHSRRKILSTRLKGLWISTVFLGLDHGFPPNPEAPLVFETMVFAVKPDGSIDYSELYMNRYATIEGARAGHNVAVELVRSGAITKEDT